MKMPFIEFISSGDLKFTIIFMVLTAFALYHFFKKIQIRNITDSKDSVDYHNVRIKTMAFWILTLSGFALLLGFMQGFYFIGKAGDVAPSIMYQGFSYALITPTFGIALFIISRFLTEIFNNKK